MCDCDIGMCTNRPDCRQKKSANERQVGGDHYKGNLQHWDLMHPAYLLGCASKYVARHKKKNGREDLEKAIHYCEKFREVTAGCVAEQANWRLSSEVLLEWAKESQMEIADYTILEAMLVRHDMIKTINYISARMAYCYPEPKAVPLTEENHYSPRIGDDEPITRVRVFR